MTTVLSLITKKYDDGGGSQKIFINCVTSFMDDSYDEPVEASNPH